MAKYAMTVRAHRPAEEVFDLLADMRNASSWDPGVTSAAGRPGPPTTTWLLARFSW